jgi:hypothetical protein
LVRAELKLLEVQRRAVQAQRAAQDLIIKAELIKMQTAMVVVVAVATTAEAPVVIKAEIQ